MPTQRAPGRPPADGINQRERLLDAALESFAGHGIASTSLRSLASSSGVTPAMLNYYFGSKQKLVDCMIEERLLPILKNHRNRLLEQASTADGAALARLFVTGLHETIESNPWLPALWVREVLAEGGQLRRLFIERIGPQLAKPLADEFAAAQQRGEINAGLEPRLLFVSLIGLTMLPFAAAPIWRPALAAEDIGNRELLEHTLALLEAGIES